MFLAEFITSVRSALGPQCLRADWRRRRPPTASQSWGCCYVAAEAVFHLAGGFNSGLRVMFVRHEDAPHWYLMGPGGEILDPTADQFTTAPDYSQGSGKGFLTREPSKRARAIMEAAKNDQSKK